ncbi:TadE family protein [Planctopirus limnophila DSM 3776]|uniref:TadE family protein n=1 Tax=Planctopirus limnophila (strain ATCC 43296 / DSM 3776 / IFAM 1008 / Mu 290) TaxID=521674 RepID=D5SYC0_PLAL2|nr:TadE/TadG family type IV pilus assembly protein [Planctopirus limnophila]ADG67648.1 TadE family protein [Planctopirus limnophila DSM 3776]
MKSVSQSGTCRKRRGFITMELALTLPILGLMLLALLQFSMLFYARSQVVEASRAGARAASLPGTTADDIETIVRSVLSPGLQDGLQVDCQLAETPGDVVAVGVSVPMTVAAPDLLWVIGISLADQNLYSETRMIRE